MNGATGREITMQIYKTHLFQSALLDLILNWFINGSFLHLSVTYKSMFSKEPILEVSSWKTSHNGKTEVCLPVNDMWSSMKMPQ